MDACGQPGVLADSEHGGRPYVFAGLDSCHLFNSSPGMQSTMWGIISSTGCAQFNEMDDCMAQMLGGTAAYLKPGQLEVLRIATQTYVVAWEPLPTSASDQEEMAVYECNPRCTDVPSMFGKDAATCAVAQEELFDLWTHGQCTSRVLVHVMSSIPSGLLKTSSCPGFKYAAVPPSI